MFSQIVCNFLSFSGSLSPFLLLSLTRDRSYQFHNEILENLLRIILLKASDFYFVKS